MMTTFAERPLSAWRFDGELRAYQREVLAQLQPTPTTRALHIVAPPGSGKTLLGILLAARAGARTLVLTPTVTIRQQWVATARSVADDESRVSQRHQDILDFTALTYQSVSVTGDSSPFELLAREHWLDELTETGRSTAAAATWLAQLEVTNPARYRTGIKHRAARVRRQFARAAPSELARVLHPNALALIDRIVAAGIDTVVLDECHHLLDHWALVVAYLVGRIREAGGRGLLIGLTATLPSPDDGRAFENYSALLGDVDYEVPTPAVVKEGHLAPYRDWVWFTEPTDHEAAFVRQAGQRLGELVDQILGSPDGLGFLTNALNASAPPLSVPLSTADRLAYQSGINAALTVDFTAARTAGSVLRVVAPEHPLTALLPEQLFPTATSDDLLSVVARFALDTLLPNPAAQAQWRYLKAALADYGLHLTDRGIRRGRNPLEKTLATSAAKDRAAVEILRTELATHTGNRMRAVVVTDVVASGNARGDLGFSAPGAKRVFGLLASDHALAGLRPVLLTANHLWVRQNDAEYLANRLSSLLQAEVSPSDATANATELTVHSVGTGRLVGAVSTLITRGEVRILVSTRGLLGEGWDCPAVNTLIDLTTVSTSTATQQLRGRTLRLDPDWPAKIAHNWSVACLVPPTVGLSDTGEISRLQRKHSHLFGPSCDESTLMTTGLEHALNEHAREQLDAVITKRPGASIAALQHAALACVLPREESLRAWRIGEPYEQIERDRLVVRTTRSSALTLAFPPVFAGSPATFFIAAGASLGVGFAVSLLGNIALPATAFVAACTGIGAFASCSRAGARAISRWRARRSPLDTYQRAAESIVDALKHARRVGDHMPIEVTVTSSPAANAGTLIAFAVRGAPKDRRVVSEAITELFGPVRAPRFLLRCAPRRVAAREVLLPVPQHIAKRRADAEYFVQRWEERIGPCELVELGGTAGLELLAQARDDGVRLSAGTSVGARTSLWG